MPEPMRPLFGGAVLFGDHMALVRPYGHGRQRKVFPMPKKRFSETLKEREMALVPPGGAKPQKQEPKPKDKK